MNNAEYIAGWISWKFKKADPDFSKSRRETLPSNLTDHTYAKRVGISSTSWIDHITHGGLTKPTDEVMNWVRSMENVFLQLHDDAFTDRTNIMKNLIQELEEHCAGFPNKVVNLFARSRIYMRCKYLNKKMEEKALLQRILKRKAAKHKLLVRGSIDDASRAKAKKMRKIIL